MIVRECGRKCVSIFSPMGEKLQSFGSEQLSSPHRVAVDDDGNILVMDLDHDCILKFTSNAET